MRPAKWPGRIAAAAMCAALVTSAAAQSEPDGLAGLTEPARTQKLVEGARKEGALLLYCSTPVEDMAPLIAAFEAKHGVRVKLWRGGPEDLLRRGATELRAGRHEVDVLETNISTVEALRREGLYRKVISPAQDDIAPAVLYEHREYVGTRLNIIIAGYNTKLVRKEDLPASYGELRDPKWKGRLAWEASDYDWFATVARAMGPDRAIETFRAIASTNGISVRNGHTLLSNLVAAGETPLSLNVFHYRIEQLARQGAPVAPWVIVPAVGRPNGIGVARKAPHPNAALLWYDFMLTDGQAILRERDFTPTNQKVQKLPDMALSIVDPTQLLDEGDKWSRLFKEIGLTKPAR